MAHTLSPGPNRSLAFWNHHDIGALVHTVMSNNYLHRGNHPFRETVVLNLKQRNNHNVNIVKG